METAYILTEEYIKWLGRFHHNWSAIDLHVDYAIYKFLQVTALQAHLITSGMMFGRKARLLVDLIKHSTHPKRTELLSVFGRITKANREIITHSYVRSNADSVTFMERKISGPFTAKEHTFSKDEFLRHIEAVAIAGEELRSLLAVSSDDLNEFATAALSLNRK
jgi:hypothetical protein